jgi:hypothetical protein
MVVATTALFVSLAGGAYAAASIDGGSIQNGTIAGSKLKHNTLTGNQINESKLGQVPLADHANSATSAATASNATNATTAESATTAATANDSNELGGIAAASYPHGVHIETKTAPSTGILPITVTATCPPSQLALGGGGGNSAPTGDVTFDSLTLAPTSYTVTMFELTPGVPVSWTATAWVACASES